MCIEMGLTYTRPIAPPGHDLFVQRVWNSVKNPFIDETSCRMAVFINT